MQDRLLRARLRPFLELINLIFGAGLNLPLHTMAAAHGVCYKGTETNQSSTQGARNVRSGDSSRREILLKLQTVTDWVAGALIPL